MSRIRVRKFCARAHRILNVDANATPDMIRSAYLRQARKWHPDMHANSTKRKQKEAGVRFREIQEAYEKLKDSNSSGNQGSGSSNFHQQSARGRQYWGQDQASSELSQSQHFLRAIAAGTGAMLMWILYARLFLQKPKQQNRTEDPRRRAENIVSMNDRLRANNEGIPLQTDTGIPAQTEAIPRKNVNTGGVSDEWTKYYQQQQQSPSFTHNPARMAELHKQNEWRQQKRAREEKLMKENQRTKEKVMLSDAERVKKHYRKTIARLNSKVAALSNRNAQLAKENRALRKKIKMLEGSE